MSGTLYVVATPLGNLADLSPRAAEALKSVSHVACEDTRQTLKLLNHLGIRKPLISCHEGNERSRCRRLAEHLRAGEDVAIVSDAGTPLISDPGFLLVRLCREEEIPVVPVPGPCAAVAALSVSGLPADRFLFLGFPPRRPGPRRRELRRWVDVSATLIFYLSPHGLEPALESLLEVLGERKAFLIREMTKVHETARFGPLSAVLQGVREEDPRGEYTLVLEGAPEKDDTGEAPGDLDVAAYVRGLMSLHRLSRSQAVRRAASELRLPRQQVYLQAGEGRESTCSEDPNE